MPARVLVAGIGNVFLGDDAFGVVLIGRLRQRAWPEGVHIGDFGIRGIDLAYALQEYDVAILVDAVKRGGEPGTLYVLEPEHERDVQPLQMHAMTPDHVLSWI